MLSTPQESPSTKKEEKLTKEILEAHNIFFVENICEEDEFTIPEHAYQLLDLFNEQTQWGTPGELRSCRLPLHVCKVRKYLLQFHAFVPVLGHDDSGVVEYLRENAPSALNKSWASGKSYEEIDALEDRHRYLLQDHCRVATEASQLMFERDESSWQHFLDRELFCDPRKDIPWHSYKESSSRCRRLTRYEEDCIMV